jgi:hypothetical protein
MAGILYADEVCDASEDDSLVYQIDNILLSEGSVIVKPSLPIISYNKDEQGNDLVMPEMVRSEQVQNDNHGVKTVTVGNANGDYALVQYESGQLHDAGAG